MFLSGCSADVVNAYMSRLRRCVHLTSSRDDWHVSGLAWLRFYEQYLIGPALRSPLNWTPTGLYGIATVQELEPAFVKACFP
jgi:hypothetical protein